MVGHPASAQRMNPWGWGVPFTPSSDSSLQEKVVDFFFQTFLHTTSNSGNIAITMVILFLTGFFPRGHNMEQPVTYPSCLRSSRRSGLHPGSRSFLHDRHCGGREPAPQGTAPPSRCCSPGQQYLGETTQSEKTWEKAETSRSGNQKVCFEIVAETAWFWNTGGQSPASSQGCSTWAKGIGIPLWGCCEHYSRQADSCPWDARGNQKCH